MLDYWLVFEGITLVGMDNCVKYPEKIVRLNAGPAFCNNV
jgi:hypothetical protein